MESAEKVLVADPIAQDGIKLLLSKYQVDVRLGLKPAELVAIIGDYAALVVRSETKVTRDVVEAGRSLRVIGRAGVGVDNIDLASATQRGIVVVNAPAGNTIAAAEHTLALILALARHIPTAWTSLRQGKWERSRFLGRELRHKVLGIAGLGRIGMAVARRAQGLEMRVLGHDPFVPAEQVAGQGVELVSLETLLREADIVSIHVPLTPQTRHLIGNTELALMKPGAYLVNCARGGIVDEAALLSALEEGRLAGAGVDVFEQEPALNNPLVACEKVIATPHLGAMTAEAQVSVAVEVAEQVIDVLEGRPARYAVNMPFILPETLSFLTPYMALAEKLGLLLAQLVEGQLGALELTYCGEFADYDTTPLKAAFVKGLLAPISEEVVNMVNAALVAKAHGLRISEKKTSICENYSTLISARAETSKGEKTVGGTVVRSEPHIVMVDRYWVDVVPDAGFWLFIHHRDRPGMIGSVGTLLGNADINISFMQVGREQPRGPAMMVLGLDEPLGEEQKKALLAILEIYSVRLVKL